MPRKGPVSKRDVLPDPLYNSKLVSRLINKMMVDGQRGKSQTILYSAFNIIQERSGKEPMEVFEAALKNIMPVLEVKARRVGGANYQVPIEVRPDRRTTLGLRWLVNYARLRGEKTMEERLANEILDAANSTGASVKKREDTHKMAEANKAFAHYRW
ncbi:small subunit ribosomal protein S7 [Peribacillus deserti]|uniref:Small ribosomal subunit protein uS7 n=2 Tax=Peribacillus deserti TaxID=673318 RepID=A0A2N5MAH0_9BACI|nr:30S ribosomal protein S7 [Peribacillus deserti]MBM7694353.1 small subunit ribosomal protein S7 [Peribacillus deserti]PLT31323.1 30S ribosomal protein S7 [Peribacillus deserti]